MTEKPRSPKERVTQAILDQHRAQDLERQAQDRMRAGDICTALDLRKQSARLTQRAERDLERWSYTTADTRVGNGGELSPLPMHGEGWELREYEKYLVEQPKDVLAHEASKARLDQAAAAGVLPQALVLSDDIKARNQIERGIAHQMAAAHAAAMSFADRVMTENARVKMESTIVGSEAKRQAASVEACRAANAMAHCMSAFQEGALALAKLRNGGNQTMTVQHVTVNEGGQAVVAQTMKAGGRKRRGRTVIR
jgi:hypothetical protein